MIDSMMNFGVSFGDLTSPQFIKNTEDKRPNTQKSLKSPDGSRGGKIFTNYFFCIRMLDFLFGIAQIISDK